MADGGSIQGVPWETLIKLVLAAGVLLIFVVIGVNLMSQARPDTDFASTTSYMRVFLGNVNEVYKTNISRSTFINLGEKRKIIYYDSNDAQKPKCNKGDRCVCLYDVNDGEDEIVQCSKLEPKLTIKIKRDFAQDAVYTSGVCFASKMALCEDNSQNFPRDSEQTTYRVLISKTSEGVEMAFS